MNCGNLWQLWTDCDLGESWALTCQKKDPIALGSFLIKLVPKMDMCAMSFQARQLQQAGLRLHWLTLYQLNSGFGEEYQH